jgi:serine/threonine-protein kinase
MQTGDSIGQYRVLERLGAGGMGEVFRAVHDTLGRVVAIKVLSPGVQTAKERFFNEARIHAALRHPNIATLFEFLEENNRCCLVMEYVDGVLLADEIARSALPAPRALQLFAPLVEAVGYLHRHEIVHRDIKASNVKINSAGEVKLLDFGIAQSGATPRLTQTGSVIGTLEYLSPEQLRGEDATPQSDIWALGVLLFEMTTGQLPFSASNVAALHEAVKNAAKLQPRNFNADLPREVETVIKRCLQNKPSARYADAPALRDAVRNALASISENHFMERDEVKVNRAKNKAPLFAGGAALAALGVLLAALLLSRPVPPAPDNPAFHSASDAAVEDATVETENEPNGVTSDEFERIKVDVVGGQAQVWRDGKVIGTTPVYLNEKQGAAISLTLRREGYEEKQVRFIVTNRKKNYSYLMEKS